MVKKDVVEMTLKEILEKEFGDDSSRILDEINQVYQDGVQGEALEMRINDVLKKAGKEPYMIRMSLVVAGG